MRVEVIENHHNPHTNIIHVFHHIPDKNIQDELNAQLTQANQLLANKQSALQDFDKQISHLQQMKQQAENAIKIQLQLIKEIKDELKEYNNINA